jgi:hypothetical protein
MWALSRNLARHEIGTLFTIVSQEGLHSSHEMGREMVLLNMCLGCHGNKHRAGGLPLPVAWIHAEKLDSMTQRSCFICRTKSTSKERAVGSIGKRARGGLWIYVPMLAVAATNARQE